MRKQLQIGSAQIGFKNFQGREGKYNREGERSFAVFLSEEDAQVLFEEGWNVKWPKDVEDEEDTRKPYLTIAISFDPYPASVWMISELRNGELNNVRLDEKEVGLLDTAELQNVDLVIRPYTWTVNGKSGTKAYLKAGYFTVLVDDFARKYGI